MYVIAIAIQKGGTAKTTTSLCLGGALTLLGYRVLLIDADPQGNATRSLIQATLPADVPTIYNVLTDNKVKLVDTILETSCGIHLVPATIQLALAEKSLLLATKGEEKLVKKISQMSSAGQESLYDFVLIDCPPSLGLLTVNALSAANGVIVPVQCEYFAESGFSDFLETFNSIRDEINEGLELVGVLLTMYSQTDTSRDVAENMRKLLGDQIFETQISRRAILTKVPLKGPVQAYAPSSDSAKEYNSMAQEVVNYVQKH
jgi:chromosome partitioning protein